MAKPHFQTLPFADHHNNGSVCRLNPIFSRVGLVFKPNIVCIYFLLKTRITSFLYGETVSRDSGRLLCNGCSNNLWCLQVIFTAWPASIPCGLQTLFSFLSHSPVSPLSPTMIGQERVNMFLEQFSTSRMVINRRSPIYLMFSGSSERLLYQNMSRCLHWG